MCFEITVIKNIYTTKLRKENTKVLMYVSNTWPCSYLFMSTMPRIFKGLLTLVNMMMVKEYVFKKKKMLLLLISIHFLYYKIKSIIITIITHHTTQLVILPVSIL